MSFEQFRKFNYGFFYDPCDVFEWSIIFKSIKRYNPYGCPKERMVMIQRPNPPFPMVAPHGSSLSARIHHEDSYNVRVHSSGITYLYAVNIVVHYCSPASTATHGCSSRTDFFGGLSQTRTFVPKSSLKKTSSRSPIFPLAH